MSQHEMLEAAYREYNPDQVQSIVLNILEPGNELLQELVDKFSKKRPRLNKAQVACFYELMSSNVGAIVGGQPRTVFHIKFSLVLKQKLIVCRDLSSARDLGA
jgi:hypothetical protein